MIYLSDIDKKLKNEQYDEITLAECKVIVELKPKIAAQLIKDFNKIPQDNKCSFCDEDKVCTAYIEGVGKNVCKKHFDYYVY